MDAVSSALGLSRVVLFGKSGALFQQRPAGFVLHDEAEYTVIRDGASIIWKELAFWEGFERFGEVAMILKAKYGNRLRDLEPTQESYLYLLGDSLAADKKILQIRGTLRT